MSEQVGVAFNFYFTYLRGGVGATGLTPLVDVWKCVVGGALTEIHVAEPATEIARGLYFVLVPGSDDATEADYVGVAVVVDATLDQQYVYVGEGIGHGGIEHLDMNTTAAVAAINAHTDAAVAAVAGGGGSVIITPAHFASLPNINGAIEIDGLPADNVSIKITADVNGVDPIANAVTDTFGFISASLALDPGTYYCWFSRGRANFPNPKVIVI